MTSESANLPAAVDRAAFEAELDALRVREKAHTREGEAGRSDDLTRSQTLYPQTGRNVRAE